MSAFDKEAGGPAFPCVTKFYEQRHAGERSSYLHNIVEAAGGMDLRDYFAGQAIVTVSDTNPNLPDSPASPSGWPAPDELAQRRARWAYLQADAMIAERAKPYPTPSDE